MKGLVNTNSTFFPSIQRLIHYPPLCSWLLNLFSRQLKKVLWFFLITIGTPPR